MQIKWLMPALADLQNHFERAEACDQLEARNLMRSVERATETLSLFPKSGRYNSGHDYYERYVPRTRMVLVYRILGSEIVIVAVFHTSRSPSDKPS